MKKTSIWFITLGIVVMIVGCFIFPNLNHVNIVDSNTWTININGIRSFPWPTFTGFVVFMMGVIFYISSWEQKGQRF